MRPSPWARLRTGAQPRSNKQLPPAAVRPPPPSAAAPPLPSLSLSTLQSRHRRGRMVTDEPVNTRVQGGRVSVGRLAPRLEREQAAARCWPLAGGTGGRAVGRRRTRHATLAAGWRSAAAGRRTARPDHTSPRTESEPRGAVPAGRAEPKRSVGSRMTYGGSVTMASTAPPRRHSAGSAASRVRHQHVHQACAEAVLVQVGGDALPRAALLNARRPRPDALAPRCRKAS